MENHINERIANSKKIDFGDVISKSINLYKNVFKEGLMHNLIVFACAIPLLLLVYIPLIPLYVDIIKNAGDPYYRSDFLNDYSIGVIIVWYLVILVLSLVLQIVSMSVFGHFFKFLKLIDTNGNEDIGGYFTILKTHFSKLVLLALATMGIALVATLLCYFPIFYAMVPIYWIFPIFVFNENLSVSEIIKAAFKFANKNWFILFGLGFVCIILSSIGMVACYIGIIFTSFFAYIAMYVTYRDSIGFADVDDNNHL